MKKPVRNLLDLPEVLAKDLWVYDKNHIKVGHRVCELDDEVIDWDKVRFWDEGESLSGAQYQMVRYTFSDGYTRLAVLYCDPEITAEDLAEWEASSAGCDYYFHRSGL